MRQTTLCVPLEVKPESCDRLTALIDTLRRAEDLAGDPQRPNFQRIFAGVPTLHFLSLSVFPGDNYDPLFIVEANFDGPPGVFWGQIETLFGDALRPMLRCCKRPLDGCGTLYDAVTAAGATAPAVAYLEARTQRPSVFHHGNRGLTRGRILDEHTLFLAARAELDDPARRGPSPYRVADAATLHARLRAALLPRFAWLADAAPVRISLGDRIADWVRLLTFVVVVLLVLSLPGVLLALLVEWRLYLLVVAVLAAVAVALLWRDRHALSGSEVATRVKVNFLSPLKLLIPLAGAAAYLVLAVVVLAPLILAVHGISLLAHQLALGPPVALAVAARETARVVALGIVSITATLPLLVLVLRGNELRDSSQETPPLDEAVLREIVRREDWIAQNHMGSIVLIKPGILRSLVIRAGHLGLGLVLRATATDGYLGSMRTVHFAHWAFLNNTSRLLFFSNFDRSWDSYLDDFIEKAHAGLTLAWGSGVGFPPTRLLLFDGASHGRQFKTWALASRTVSRFWYSAYRDLTVDQIERNWRLACGLRRPSLNEAEAAAWAWDL